MPDVRPDVSAIRLSLPVTVLLERRVISRSFWSLPSWYLSGVMVGEGLESGLGAGPEAGANAAPRGPERRGIPVRHTADGEEFAWSGYHVTLFKDACERYWHALIGDRPKVYVVCRDVVEHGGDAVPNEGMPDIEPWVVTVDYDEATAFAETDEQVLSCEITPELYRYMEAFVLQHYKPKAFHKRKRRKGTATAGPTDASAAGSATMKSRPNGRSSTSDA